MYFGARKGDALPVASLNGPARASRVNTGFWQQVKCPPMGIHESIPEKSRLLIGFNSGWKLLVIIFSHIHGILIGWMASKYPDTAVYDARNVVPRRYCPKTRLRQRKGRRAHQSIRATLQVDQVAGARPAVTSLGSINLAVERLLCQGTCTCVQKYAINTFGTPPPIDNAAPQASHALSLPTTALCGPACSVRLRGLNLRGGTSAFMAD